MALHLFIFFFLIIILCSPQQISRRASGIIDDMSVISVTAPVRPLCKDSPSSLAGELWRRRRSEPCRCLHSCVYQEQRDEKHASHGRGSYQSLDSKMQGRRVWGRQSNPFYQLCFFFLRFLLRRSYNLTVLTIL